MTKQKTKTIPLAKAAKIKEVVYPKVRLLSDQILTTSFKHTVTATGIILQNNSGNLEEKQMVVCAGPHSSAKVGEWVQVNPDSFAKSRSNPAHDIGPDNVKIIVPIEVIADKEYLLMSTRNIKYIYDDSVTPPEVKA